MRFQEKLPLPLKKVCEDLEEMGIEAIVHRAKVDYDERIKGTDVTLTLEIRIEDIYKERDTEESAFERAMGLIE